MERETRLRLVVDVESLMLVLVLVSVLVFSLLSATYGLRFDMVNALSNLKKEEEMQSSFTGKLLVVKVTRSGYRTLKKATLFGIKQRCRVRLLGSNWRWLLLFLKAFRVSAVNMTNYIIMIIRSTKVLLF